MLLKQSKFEHGKRVIQELLKQKKIGLEEYYNLVNDEIVANHFLSANVFSFDPVSKTVSFQSPLMYAYVQEVYAKDILTSKKKSYNILDILFN